MDKIIIRDLVARGIIGVHDWERDNPQEILINLVLTTNLQPAGESDKIDETVDYGKISRRVLHHAEISQRLTVEALAADLAKICLEDRRIHSVMVRVEKPAAIRFARSVGVEIERSRAV